MRVPSASTASAPVERLEGRADVDLDPPALELVVRVLAELARDLREDPRSGVDEHPALRRAAERRVRPADGVLGEVVQLGQRLDARVARADEDEAEVACGLVRIEARRGGLERAQEPVAERDRVGDVLEPLAVLGEAGDGERPRNGAERDDESLVADLERAAERLGDDRLRSRVAREDAAEQQLRVRAHASGAARRRAAARASRPPPRAGAACRA